QANEEEYQKAKEIVKPLKDKVSLIWNDSPELKQVINLIEEQLPLGPRGKGRSVWTAPGCIISKNEVAAIAFHDADILKYNVGKLKATTGHESRKTSCENEFSYHGNLYNIILLFWDLC
ncbi:MAG TPA: hypothetical protein PLA79_07540, partial [Bacteroidales bacterium]|nr:hypothetical protein [Bacteroidales bacterium]